MIYFFYFPFLSTVENQETKTSHTFNQHFDAIRQNFVIKKRFLFIYVYIFYFYSPLDFKSQSLYYCSIFDIYLATLAFSVTWVGHTLV